MEETTSSYEYVGSELEHFANATNWQTYVKERIQPFIGRRVLEVGAGIGGATRFLCTGDHDHWMCLEPDRRFIAVIEDEIEAGRLPPCCQTAHGVLPTPLFTHGMFDTALYINVLEHIEKDQREIEEALAYLKPGGFLIVLSPAHDWLFSPFDAARGHFRRYSKPMIRALTPDSGELVRLEYLDSIGLFASLANRLVLKQREPRPDQIAYWDERMVPLSKRVDPLVKYSIGKSIVAIWKRL